MSEDKLEIALNKFRRIVRKACERNSNLEIALCELIKALATERK